MSLLQMTCLRGFGSVQNKGNEIDLPGAHKTNSVSSSGRAAQFQAQIGLAQWRQVSSGINSRKRKSINERKRATKADNLLKNITSTGNWTFLKTSLLLAYVYFKNKYIQYKYILYYFISFSFQYFICSRQNKHTYIQGVPKVRKR